MGLPVILDAALQRLLGALDQLESATGRLGEAVAERRDLENTMEAVQNQRTQLANERDAALDRTRALERATDEISSRLSFAGTTLRRLLASAEEG